jgi:hypothetical protein
MKTISAQQFQYVQEREDQFLALFPHRFDYIWAKHPVAGQSPEWKTESRYPLSDRLIRQGAYLYGVRFGAETSYGILDIDSASPYHPQQDPFALPRILAALEPLGLVHAVIVTSSYSGGLHVYLPFSQPRSSWQLAIALAALLENAGFRLYPGHLELFPNPKPYIVDTTPSLFNAHRLPLQAGSYLLNSDLEPIWTSEESFIQQWRFAQQGNEIEPTGLKQLLKQVKQRHFRISGKAEKFINDLNAEIELGWTGHGQTNRLLGRITMREYIFHHVISGEDPLEGQTLIDVIVKTAQGLPGYREWCRHQHEIEHRVEEWVRCIEKSHYFRYGDASSLTVKSGESPLDEAIEQLPGWNQRQSEATRDRIRRAIVDLLENGVLPAKPTARFHALLQYNIGGGSLYRHRDLWHPDHLLENHPVENLAGSDPVENPVELPPTPPNFKQDSQLDCVEDASNWLNPTSLFPGAGGNVLPSRDYEVQPLAMEDSLGGNSVQPQSGQPLCERSLPDLSLETQAIHQILADIKAKQDACREANRIAYEQQRQLKRQASEAQLSARMQQFLESGDPILVAEALAFQRKVSAGQTAVETMG